MIQTGNLSRRLRVTLFPLRLVALARLLLLCAVIVVPFNGTFASPIDDLQSSFTNPPADSRIMMRWWWFGPAVTKPELEREMRLMKEGGIGGFEVQPVYPLSLDDPAAGIKNLPFLSDEFIEALRFTSNKAHELGLRFDLTLGSGWPFGGPTVSIDNAAGRLRYEHVKVDPDSHFVKVPPIGPGEKLLAVFLARAAGSSFAPESIRELKTIKNGVVEVASLPPGQNEVLFFISSRTGMQVKRPALGAEGFVLDHLNRAATDMYLKTVGDRLMQAFSSNPPHAIFCDSLEVYGSDWSSDFLEEFQRRRGYDLKPHLPALVNEFGAETKALRRDWGLTLTELLNERFLGPIHQWAREHHTLFRVQDYGVPAAALSSNAFVDLAEGEGAEWKTLSATRWASSANHIYDRTITSSETWTWLHSPSFRATPLDMKAEADRHFLVGVNQLIGHGWPYTPAGIEYPGWRFYASAVFDEKNPWWIVMPDVAGYLQRLSFMMRQGKPANDVAIYLPNDDAWSSFTPGNANLRETLARRIGRDLIPKVIEAGYGFDFFDADMLRHNGKVDHGALVLGPNRYRAVILPNVETISLDAYTQLEEFARAGGVVIATRQKPSAQPGATATVAAHNRIRSISDHLFAGSGAPGLFIENEATQLSGELRRRLTPDLVSSPDLGDIGFVHRRTTDAEIYFLANTSNESRKVSMTFRVKELQPELWDPFSGKVAGATVEKEVNEGVAVQLHFEPYGSQLLVFAKRKLLNQQRLNSSVTSAIDLSRDWRVTFAGQTNSLAYDQLHSWSDVEPWRYFSGTASYEKEVDIDAERLRGNRKVRLDLGDATAIPEQTLKAGMQAWLEPPVREAAIVYIDDHMAGSLWCPPYSVDVTSLVRAGKNHVRIVVANTAMNYMAGHSLPDYRLLNLRFGERFQPQDMDKVQPLPSGLVGKPRLIFE